jgi:ADP-heptose:LPS heptosyltransferase
LGKPIVALFGDSSAERWRPWKVRHEVLQPLSRDVIALQVDDVIAAFSRLTEGLLHHCGRGAAAFPRAAGRPFREHGVFRRRLTF